MRDLKSNQIKGVMKKWFKNQKRYKPTFLDYFIELTTWGLVLLITVTYLFLFLI